MPYIDAEARRQVEKHGPSNKGELNYAITRLMAAYIRRAGKNYQNISDAIAAARDAADECKRRVLDPYEDAKIQLNGDVYP